MNSSSSALPWLGSRRPARGPGAHREYGQAGLLEDLGEGELRVEGAAGRVTQVQAAAGPDHHGGDCCDQRHEGREGHPAQDSTPGADASSPTGGVCDQAPCARGWNEPATTMEIATMTGPRSTGVTV